MEKKKHRVKDLPPFFVIATVGGSGRTTFRAARSNRWRHTAATLMLAWR